MSRVLVKQKIMDYLRRTQGVKAVELASSPEIVLALENESFGEVVEELVADHEIVEIEYVVSNIPYRLKSFFLPGGSVVHRVRGQYHIVKSDS